MSSFLHTHLNFQMFVLQTKPSTVEILEGIDKVCIFLSWDDDLQYIFLLF